MNSPGKQQLSTPDGSPDGVVRLEAVTKAYPGVVANDAIDFELRRGEVHALVGENGAGKSTLVSILYGLQRPDAGRVTVDGHELRASSPRDALAAGIGLVQQHFALIETLTAAQNLLLALANIGKRPTVRACAARLRELGELYGLPLDPDVPISDLTVGERQRAELLKTLALDVRYLALDEPTSVLTPSEAQGLVAMFPRMTGSGVGVLFISHKLEEVLGVAHRVSVLRAGKLVGTFDTAAEEIDERSVAVSMVGRVVADSHNNDRVEAVVGTPRLRVRQLRAQSTRGSIAVHDVDLDVRAAEVVGLAGVEGSGQVELTEAIAGVRKPLRGAIELDGVDVSGAGVRQRHRLGLGHIPSDRRHLGLVPNMSIAENAVLPLLDDRRYSRYGMARRRSMELLGEELIERFDVRAAGPDVRAGTLSGGNQQKLVLARELMREPTVLVCCYPTIGLDVAASHAVRGRILEMRSRGAAILYASTDLDELLAVSDRILVMHQGGIAGEVNAAEASATQIGLLMGGRVAS